MKRLIEQYGRVAAACAVAIVILPGLEIFGQKLHKKVNYEQPKTVGNVTVQMRSLSEQGKYPFFSGSRYITLNLGYKGEDGIEGFSREDALSFVEAYEYEEEGKEEVLKKIDKGKIKVYPFDDATERIREFVDVTNTGKYSVRYSVEGESGLKADMVMLVLVDILPEGVECRESVGEEHESSG